MGNISIQYELTGLGAGIPKTEFEAQGVVDGEEFIRRRVGESRIIEYKRDHKSYWAEVERINELLKRGKFSEFMEVEGGHHEYVDFDNSIGIVKLLESAESYYEEQFMPEHWFTRAKSVQSETGEVVGRTIFLHEMELRNGEKKRVYIKAPKKGISCYYQQPSGWLTDINSIGNYKSSQRELENLVELREQGVLTENPLGYFEQGVEQYLFTEETEGVSPLGVLEGDQRDELLKADAIMLARLFLAGFRHQYFYSPKFDDKMWTEEGLVLIDVDETIDLKLGIGSGIFRRDYDFDSMKDTHISLLIDCLSEYHGQGVLRDRDLTTYAENFLNEMGYDASMEGILSEISKDRLTEESLNAMVADCD